MNFNRKRDYVVMTLLQITSRVTNNSKTLRRILVGTLKVIWRTKQYIVKGFRPFWQHLKRKFSMFFRRRKMEKRESVRVREIEIDIEIDIER